MKARHSQLVLIAVRKLREAAQEYAEGHHGVNRLALLGQLQFAVKVARDAKVPEDVINRVVIDEFLAGKEEGNG